MYCFFFYDGHEQIFSVIFQHIQKTISSFPVDTSKHQLFSDRSDPIVLPFYKLILISFNGVAFSFNFFGF